MEFLLIGTLGFVALLVTVFAALFLRRVVPTNEVHIVQTAKETKSYGKDTGFGNTYYEWPSWIPMLGVTRTTLPVSNFDIDLSAYEAYDKGRLPFVVDVKAFFRVADSGVAAQRVANFDELHGQLMAIVQGAVRTILSTYDLEKIMQERSIFGEQFTKEVSEQLANWGVIAVKNLELMDIRDSNGSNVIKNIMEKKKSLIEMESRTEVANNKQLAEVAEITARQTVELRNQEAKQITGLRQVEVERQISLDKEKALQVVKEQAKITMEKDMAVKEVENTKIAEINKAVAQVKAEQDKAVAVVAAEQQKQTAVIKAQADFDAKKLQAEADFTIVKRKADAAYEAKQRESDGIKVEGQAQAEVEKAVGTAQASAIEAKGLAEANAKKALESAQVEGQIRLAGEIGTNEKYQSYLVTIEQIKAGAEVGKAQAMALTNADIKVIATGGSAESGLNSVGELVTAKGGVQLGTMLEGLKATETGNKLLNLAGLGDTTKQ